jgi:nicotinate-nucleotide--dimethylbenzimidazole phosphoribosyltransferase
VDGFIATSALLVAHALYPSVKEYCLFAHTSEEQGHQRMLAYLKAKPLLHMGLRLGEGTGAALAIPILQNSLAFLNEMASFESAGISNR